jgi:hypothetical protein
MPRPSKTKPRQSPRRPEGTNKAVPIDSPLGKQIVEEFFAVERKRHRGDEISAFEVCELQFLLHLPPDFSLEASQRRKKLLIKLLLNPFLKGSEELVKTVEALKNSEQMSQELSGWEECIILVFHLLIERALKQRRPLPLKHEVQYYSKKYRALERILGRRVLSIDNLIDYLFTEPEPKLSAELEGVMQAMADPRWDRLFERCGLSRLPARKGGRPKGRKNLLQ